MPPVKVCGPRNTEHVSVSRTHTTCCEAKTSHSHRGKRWQQEALGIRLELRLPCLQGLVRPLPPSTISQDGCPLPPSPIFALCPLGRRIPGEVTLMLSVRLSQKMKNYFRSALPRSFGPLPICHYCTQASFLLSQHESASQA